MDNNSKVLQVYECMMNERINFKEMCELIQKTISDNPKQYSLEKYIKLKSTLETEVNDNYKMKRNYFKNILSAFCFSDCEGCFKKNNNFILFKSDQKYFLELLANYSSTEFKCFRNGEFEKLSNRYIVEEVDAFLTFIKPYCSPDHIDIYNKCKAKLEKLTNYSLLQAELFNEEITEFTESIKNGLFPVPCLCSKKTANQCDQKCENHLKNNTCSLTSKKSKKPYKDLSAAPCRCFRQDGEMFYSFFLYDEEKRDWLRYAYSELLIWKKRVTDVFTKMDDLASEAFADNILERTVEQNKYTHKHAVQILRELINSEIENTPEYRKIIKDFFIESNKRILGNEKKIKNLETELNKLVRSNRKSALISILNRDIKCELSDHEIDELLDEIDAPELEENTSSEHLLMRHTSKILLDALSED